MDQRLARIGIVHCANLAFGNVPTESASKACSPARLSPVRRVRCQSSAPGAEGLVQLWSLATEQVVATLRGHTAQVRDLHRHPCGGLLASAGFDKTIRLWAAAPEDADGETAEALAKWAPPAPDT